MNGSKLSIDQILYESGLRINNSINDNKVLDAVSPMGYPVEKLNEGAALLNEASTLSEVQNKEYGELNEAQSKFEIERVQANSVYIDQLKIARIALKNDAKAQVTLELNGRRATTFSGWLKQTLGFYRAILANNDWITALAAYGQTQEKLTAQLTAIEAVATASEAVKKEKGDAQNATEERDMKLEELVDWVNDYEVIAQIALADKPQLLEKLGIVVKN